MAHDIYILPKLYFYIKCYLNLHLIFLTLWNSSKSLPKSGKIVM